MVARRVTRAARWKAWLGTGSSRTDTLRQTVTLPATGAKTLSFYLRIDSAETTTTLAYDTLTVGISEGLSSTTLATYSNLDKGPSYVLRTFDLSAWAGRTVSVVFTGVEDASLQTSFVIDDTGVT